MLHESIATMGLWPSGSLDMPLEMVTFGLLNYQTVLIDPVSIPATIVGFGSYSFRKSKLPAPLKKAVERNKPQYRPKHQYDDEEDEEVRITVAYKTTSWQKYYPKVKYSKATVKAKFVGQVEPEKPVFELISVEAHINTPTVNFDLKLKQNDEYAVFYRHKQAN